MSFLLIIQDDTAGLWEAAALVCVYVVYVSLVMYLYISGKEVDPHLKKVDEYTLEAGEEGLQLLAPNDDDADSDVSPALEISIQRRLPVPPPNVTQEAPSMVDSPLRRVGTSLWVNSEKMFFLSRPVVAFLIPPLYPAETPSINPLHSIVSRFPAPSRSPTRAGRLEGSVSLHRVASIFIISVVLIGVLSSMLLDLVQYTLTFVSLDSSTVSATLMALGSEVLFPCRLPCVSHSMLGSFKIVLLRYQMLLIPCL